MTEEFKATLGRYLTDLRAGVLWKLDGLSEYDRRRPLTPTGTNLLGLVKHLAAMEIGYFGAVFGRPSGEPEPWFADDADPNADLWATPEESTADVVSRYRRACAHADHTIADLDLASVGSVAWWPEERRAVTLHQVMVHMLVETSRHAGHADLVRELVDGSTGMRPADGNLPSTDPAWWRGYVERVERAARAAGSGETGGT